MPRDKDTIEWLQDRISAPGQLRVAVSHIYAKEAP